MEREVNLPRIRKVLAEQNPFLAGEVTDVWVKERHYADQDGPQALADFTAARKETLGLLDGLEAEWSPPGPACHLWPDHFAGTGRFRCRP